MKLYEYEGEETQAISDAKAAGTAIHHCVINGKSYVSLDDSILESVKSATPSLREVNGANFGGELQNVFYAVREASPAVAAIRNAAVQALLENPGIYNVLMLIVYELVLHKADEQTEKVKQRIVDIYTESCQQAIDIGF